MNNKNIVIYSQIHIPTKVDYCDLNQVRIVPKIDHYVVEVVYEKEETDYGLDSVGHYNQRTLISNHS